MDEATDKGSSMNPLNAGVSDEEILTSYQKYVGRKVIFITSSIFILVLIAGLAGSLGQAKITTWEAYAAFFARFFPDYFTANWLAETSVAKQYNHWGKRNTLFLAQTYHLRATQFSFIIIIKDTAYYILKDNDLLMADSRRAFEIFGRGMAQEFDLSHVVPIGEEGNFDSPVLDFGVSQPDLVAYGQRG